MGHKIAFLGWGSLLWEKDDKFEQAHGEWSSDGPSFDLEFSRISQTGDRRGALTLVIDRENGTAITVAHCLSRQTDPVMAIDHLRVRERMPSLQNMGYVFLRQNWMRCHDDEYGKAVREWATANRIDVVIWSDLQSNYTRMQNAPFSVSAAKKYLQALHGAERAQAFKYIKNAPRFVVTKLRTALKNESWIGP
jgi:hypothetical protein